MDPKKYRAIYRRTTAHYRNRIARGDDLEDVADSIDDQLAVLGDRHPRYRELKAFAKATFPDDIGRHYIYRWTEDE